MPQTPTLAEVIEGAMDARLERQYTMLPGVVVSYNASNQTASVQATVKHRYTNERGEIVATDLPVIPGCVVSMPRGAGRNGITFPIEGGTGVVIFFSSASLDRWKGSSGTRLVDTADDRRNCFADAIVVAGLHTNSNAPFTEADIADGTQLHGEGIYIGDLQTDMVFLGDPTADDPVALKSDLDTIKPAILAGLDAQITALTAGLPATASELADAVALRADISANWPVCATKVKAK